MKKKRVVLFAHLFVFATSTVFAQFTAGPKAGLNVSDVYYDIPILDDEVRFRQGLNVGVFGNYRLHDRLDLQAELLYSQQGYKSVVPVIDIGGTRLFDGYKLLAHYLNIPVLLQFYPVKRIYLEAGPQVGFRFGHKYYSGEMDWDDIDLNRGRRTADFSFVGGVGILLGQRFSVNARYCHSLQRNSPSQGIGYGNRVIQFSVAYDLWGF